MTFVYLLDQLLDIDFKVGVVHRDTQSLQRENRNEIYLFFEMMKDEEEEDKEELEYCN